MNNVKAMTEIVKIIAVMTAIVIVAIFKLSSLHLERIQTIPAIIATIPMTIAAPGRTLSAFAPIGIKSNNEIREMAATMNPIAYNVFLAAVKSFSSTIVRR